MKVRINEVRKWKVSRINLFLRNAQLEVQGKSLTKKISVGRKVKKSEVKIKLG